MVIVTWVKLELGWNYDRFGITIAASWFLALGVGLWLLLALELGWT